MNIRGSRTLDAPRAAVFDAICDPETLLAVIPGCRAIERTSDTEYRGEIALRLPGIVGTYRTLVSLVEADPPSHGRLEGEVVGSLGSVRGDASFRLAESDRGTTVEFDGRATLSGPLARLDSRFLEGLVSTLIGQALGNLESRLQQNPPVGVVGDGRPTAKEIPG
jgi:2-furoyl-CoA dehydrogenase large subunit